MKKSELTKERIISAAARLLSEKGFTEARTAELASEAGLSEGAIFRYFPSKSKLVEAVVRHFIHELHSELNNVLTEADGLSEQATIETIIDFHFGFFSWKGGILRNIINPGSPKNIDVPVRVLIEEGLLPYVAKITDLLKSGMEKGRFRTGDASLMATALIGLMQIVILRKLALGADYSFAEAKAEVKHLFFSGILI